MINCLETKLAGFWTHTRAHTNTHTCAHTNTHTHVLTHTGALFFLTTVAMPLHVTFKI